MSCTDKKPKLQQLQQFDGVKGVVRVIDAIAYKWEEVAIAFGFNGPSIERIKKDAFYRNKKATTDMFVEWLEEGDSNSELRTPVTWSTLVECLKEAQLAETSILIESGNLTYSGKQK